MKLVFWGGPWDEQVHEIYEIRPIRVPEPVIETWGPDWLPERTDIMDLRETVYWPRQMYHPHAMQRLGGRTWWVMVPVGVGDEEAQRMFDRHARPVVDGGHGR